MKSILILMVFAGLATVFSVQAKKPLQKKISQMQDSNVAVSGVDLFIEKPTNYNFICTSTSKGEVLSASLSDNGEMSIKYASYWDDGDHSGSTKGIYNYKKNNFQGTYRTNDGKFSGEINFSFNEKGEAYGTWDNGYGVIKITLKKKVTNEK